MVSSVTVFFNSKAKIHSTGLSAFEILGVLFNIIGKYDSNQADWLHNHPHPKPFSVNPIYTDEGILVGMRINSFFDKVNDLLSISLKSAQEQKELFFLKDAEFSLELQPISTKYDWIDLQSALPKQKVTLRFHSPTCFRKGSAIMPLPIPHNVFDRPFRIWQKFAPRYLNIEPELLAWVDKHVTVTALNIQTAQFILTNKLFIKGFIGDVAFHAKKGPKENLVAFQSLANLSVFSGVGYKTTMGMGIVERID
jgi:CRISPR-associated endoribonuclease Cas6